MFEYNKLSKVKKDIIVNFLTSGIAFLILIIRDWFVISTVDDSSGFYIAFISITIMSSIASNVIYFRVSNVLEISMKSIFYFIFLNLIMILFFSNIGFDLSCVYLTSMVVLILQGIPNGYFFHNSRFFFSKLDRILSPTIFVSILYFDFEISIAFSLSVMISLFITLLLSINFGFKIKFVKKCSVNVERFFSLTFLIDIIATILPNLFWRYYLERNPQSVVLVRAGQIIYSFAMIALLPTIKCFKENNKVVNSIVLTSISTVIYSIFLFEFAPDIEPILAVIISITCYYLMKVYVVGGKQLILNIKQMAFSIILLSLLIYYNQTIDLIILTLMSIISCICAYGMRGMHDS